MAKHYCGHGKTLWTCKICSKRAHREYEMKWVGLHREQYREEQLRWRENHPDYWRIYLPKWKVWRHKDLGSRNTEIISKTRNNDKFKTILENEMRHLKLK